MYDDNGRCETCTFFINTSTGNGPILMTIFGMKDLMLCENLQLHPFSKMNFVAPQWDGNYCVF